MHRYSDTLFKTHFKPPVGNIFYDKSTHTYNFYEIYRFIRQYLLRINVLSYNFYNSVANAGIT